MDEQQTYTAEQIWEMAKPHIITGLQKASAHFREGAPPADTMRWAYTIIRSMPAPGGKQ